MLNLLLDFVARACRLSATAAWVAWVLSPALADEDIDSGALYLWRRGTESNLGATLLESYIRLVLV
jgi:hypothetical protein